jgi:serine protease AprX
MNAGRIGRIGFAASLVSVAVLLATIGAVRRDSRAQTHAADPDDGGGMKCSPRLRELLASSRANDTIAVWIFFTDRGAAGTPMGEPRMSFRSADRRFRRGGSAVEPRDLPVHQGYIDSLRGRLVRLRHASRYFNAVSAEVEAREIPALCACDFVSSVDRVASCRIPESPIDYPAGSSPPPAKPAGRSIDYGASFDQLNQVGAVDLLERGYNGSGSISGLPPVLIAILDTGFKLDHAALREVQIEAQWDFVQGDSVVSDQVGDPADQGMHGTAVLGVIAGHAEGQLVGPAWGARYLLAKTEIIGTEQPIEEDHWIAGIEWADSAGADVVSSSLGYINWYTRDQLDGSTALCTIAADIAASHGIVVVNSAGNEGAAGLIAPADGFSVLAIGAVDRSGVVVYFSSRGPTADGRIKPDFMAMGLGVRSVSYWNESEYMGYNGTSFAAPIVGGLCALLLEMNPYWSPMELRDTLRATSSRSTSPDNVYGWGIPNGSRVQGITITFDYARAFPNPFSVETRLQLSLSSPASMTVGVYDCRGALVKTLARRGPVQRSLTLSWDGTNERGEPVASGVYLLHVDSWSVRRTVKVILIR